MSVNSIYKLLDKLEMMVLKSPPVPLSPFIIVNHEKVIDILDKIRTSIPGEIQEAHSIIRKSEEIQAEARKRAEMLMIEARNHAEKMLSESELLNAVQAEANKIREEVVSEVEMIRNRAREEAERIKMASLSEAMKIREGADKYAETILCNLDNDLGEMHEIVKNGQRHLCELKEESMAEMSAEMPEQEEMSRQKQRELSYKIKR
ncbi:MAG: hypothetical protein A2Y25_07530 [Candidatus Melainabacteria bacterium GWF2_37_15]|nr:MAG: hypothetical protein A2Y25_07530 [Candidatus Melainabacteria bacterium GWF2_37_15]